MCEIKETLSRSVRMLIGSLAESILPHRHEAIIYSGYISQKKNDKFQIPVPALTAGFQVKNLPDSPFTAFHTSPRSRVRAFLFKKKKKKEFLFLQQLMPEVLRIRGSQNFKSKSETLDLVQLDFFIFWLRILSFKEVK